MAAPSPESELDALRTELRATGLPKVLLLTGPSDFFRTEAFDLAVASVGSGIELRRLDGGGEEAKTDGSEILDLRGGGLFAKGTVLAVRRAKAWLEAHAERLVETLPKIADGCALILELQKLDKRTKLAKELTGGSGARALEFREMYAEPYDRRASPLDAELVGWVVDRARRGHGISLTREAAYQLVAVVGRDPAELVGELRTLASQFVGRPPRQRVDVADLRGLLDARFESTPFEFVEALLGDDRLRALRSLRAMFARGVRGRDGQQVDAGGVFPFTASWLHTSLGQAHAGRMLVESGAARVEDVARAVGVRGFTDRYRETVERHPVHRLQRGLLLLREAQRRIRSSGEDPQWVLEDLVAQWFAGREPSVLPRRSPPSTGGGGRRSGARRPRSQRTGGRR
jgi:DNA polymerase III delta subunit